MIFHKQRAQARTTIAITARVRVGEFTCGATLLNASPRGVLAEMSNPPVRGTKVELLVGGLVLPGQVRWRGRDCCGIALRHPINVADLVEGQAAPSAFEQRRQPRRPAAFLRAIIGERATG